jgi:hypothetical protein
MEILTPISETPTEEFKDIPIEPSEEVNESAKNIEFLALLGMKDEMFNKDVMEKISYLSSRLSLDDLQELAIRSGNDTQTSKLDRIYTYVKLSKMESDHARKFHLIHNAKNQWLMKDTPQQSVT